MQWHWVDLVIMGIIALSVLTGLIRGFVKELIAILVWVLAIWIGYHYSSVIEPWFERYIQDKTIRTVASFVILLVATLLVGGIVNGLLAAILKRSGLGGTDRLLGMVFGFCRGVFIVALIMTVVKMTSIPYKNYYKESKLYAQFDPIVNWMHGFIPNMLIQAKQLDKFSLTEVAVKQDDIVNSTRSDHEPENATH